MSPVAEIGRRCEVAGVRVIRAEGFERRGNGLSWPAGGPGGLVNHHTAGGNNIYLDRNLITGRPDLAGPLCNFATLYDGDLALVAAHPANHAGASGGWDTAPFPVTRLFNQLVLGNEIQYRGTEPMSPAQWRTILILSRVTLEVTGRAGQWDRIKFHQGTSVTGKSDASYAPGRTYDIAAFRRAVAAALQEDDMPSLNEIFNHPIPRAGEGQTGVTTLGATVAYLDSNLGTLRRRIDETANAILALEATQTGRDEALAAQLAEIKTLLPKDQTTS